MAELERSQGGQGSWKTWPPLSRESQQCLSHLWQRSRRFVRLVWKWVWEGAGLWLGAGAEGAVQKDQQFCLHLAARVTLPEEISPVHEPRELCMMSCCRETPCCRDHSQCFPPAKCQKWEKQKEKSGKTSLPVPALCPSLDLFEVFMCAGAVETRHCPRSIFITWIPHICASLGKLMREFSVQAKHQLHRPENQPPLQHKHTSFTKKQQFGCPYPAEMQHCLPLFPSTSQHIWKVESTQSHPQNGK